MSLKFDSTANVANLEAGNGQFLACFHMIRRLSQSKSPHSWTIFPSELVCDTMFHCLDSEFYDIRRHETRFVGRDRANGGLMEDLTLNSRLATLLLVILRFGNPHPIERICTMKKTSLISGSLLLLFILNLLSTQLSGQQTVAPESIVGREKCAQCHGKEFKAWELSSHGKSAWSLLDHPKAGGYARELGITNVKGNSMCTQCHGTHQITNGQLSVLPGNSCESCHGGASGWIANHYEFGQGRIVDGSTKMAELMADRLRESDRHRALRDAVCTQAGMNRSENSIAIAKNCLSCHLVPNEALIKAGHPISSSFELVRWSNGEVRHNFLLDQTTNNEAATNWLDEFRNGPGRTVDGRKRLMYLAGKLADLEISLRIRGRVTSTKRGTLGDEMNDRILEIQERLGQLNIDDLDAVLKAIKNLDKRSLREITNQDQTAYNAIADSVAAAAKQFMSIHASGNKLPTEIRVKKTGKGEPYDGR